MPDVEQFPEHIAYSSLSKSEMVVPIFHQTKVGAILDVDSINLSEFNEIDKQYLEEIVRLIVW